jgi:hypothetical protein
VQRALHGIDSCTPWLRRQPPCGHSLSRSKNVSSVAEDVSEHMETLSPGNDRLPALMLFTRSLGHIPLDT